MVSRLIAFYINPSPQQFANDQAGEREIVTNKFLDGKCSIIILDGISV